MGRSQDFMTPQCPPQMIWNYHSRGLKIGHVCVCCFPRPPFTHIKATTLMPYCVWGRWRWDSMLVGIKAFTSGIPSLGGTQPTHQSGCFEITDDPKGQDSHNLEVWLEQKQVLCTFWGKQESVSDVEAVCLTDIGLWFLSLKFWSLFQRLSSL